MTQLTTRKKLSDIGEFGLIDRIRKVNPVKDRNVVIGIGDDAAAIKVQGSRFKTQDKGMILLTTDTLVEGVHFDLKYFTFYELGWKLLAVNLSDIAAMGGTPKYALVTLGLKKSVKVADVDSFYGGIKALAKKYGVKVVGGDIVRSPRNLFFTMDLMGVANKIVTRAGARPGDLIISIGSFGASALGLARLKKHGRSAAGVNPHLMPLPMVKEGRSVSRSASAMIDNSDGLARCLIEICKASKVGAKVYLDRIPIAKGATLKQALDGGEDYNLLLTVPRSKVRSVKNGIGIGIVTGGRKIVLIDKNGNEKVLKDKGYEQI